MTSESRTHPPGGFATTRWSLVLAAGRPGDAGTARRALIELCLRYWYPVYAYLRSRGHAPEIAQDLAAGFFEHLLERQAGMPEGPLPRRFREYLLEALDAYLDGDWQDATEAAPVAEFDRAVSWREFEARRRRDPPVSAPPRRVYDREYALQVLGNTLARVREEAGQAGRGALFDALAPWIGVEPDAARLERIALELRLRPLTVTVALKRLRQRFRELAAAELADTLGGDPDLRAERAALADALRAAAP